MWTSKVKAASKVTRSLLIADLADVALDLEHLFVTQVQICPQHKPLWNNRLSWNSEDTEILFLTLLFYFLIEFLWYLKDQITFQNLIYLQIFSDHFHSLFFNY